MIRIVSILAGPGGGSSGGGGGFGFENPLASSLLQLLIKISDSLKVMASSIISFLSKEIDLSILDEYLPFSVGIISVLDLLFGVGVFVLLTVLLFTIVLKILP